MSRKTPISREPRGGPYFRGSSVVERHAVEKLQLPIERLVEKRGENGETLNGNTVPIRAYKDLRARQV